MGYGIPRAAVQDLGFADEDELLRMVQAVDLSTSTSLAAFVRWKHEDGTKEGLARLPVVAADGGAR